MANIIRNKWEHYDNEPTIQKIKRKPKLVGDKVKERELLKQRITG